MKSCTLIQYVRRSILSEFLRGAESFPHPKSNVVVTNVVFVNVVVANVVVANVVVLTLLLLTRIHYCGDNSVFDDQTLSCLYYDEKHRPF
jgi:hypothetical protein